MPPANTPLESPSRTPAAAGASPPQGSTPVPIPTTSLRLQSSRPDDAAHDDNPGLPRVRMRYSADSSSLSRQRRRRQQYLTEEDGGHRMELDDMRSARMGVEVNRRIPIIRRPREEAGNRPNYEGRVSSLRSLYGWAPGSDDDNEEPFPDTSAISSWFGRPADWEPARNAPSRRHLRRENGGRTSSALTGDSSDSGSRSRIPDAALSTEGLLQSIRRQPRLPRTRTLRDYLLDQHRERGAGQEAEERDRPGSLVSRAYRVLPSNRGESHRSPTNDDRPRINLHRLLHIENPPSPKLQETIKYLEGLRYSGSYAESISSAAAGGLIPLDLFAWDDDDFILDTASLAPPPECSWLRPGVVFSGSQRAASSNTLFSRVSNPSMSAQDPVIVNGSETGRISVYTTSGRRYLAPSTVSQPGNTKDDDWPVKVTIHSINYKDMTLSGTMEAYNIPDKTSPTHDAHIITFLEGEIIDFNTHTLETKNFRADAGIDSTYWRELQPFKDLTDDEMIKNLVSKKWISDDLVGGWILMRWKERCFITPTDSRQGLTISGFYYISLRRDNGQIEGLYYDPGSSPYQQLSLKPETNKMVRPSYCFR
ncbi:hypothetical protein ASPZODRAFT_131210 [Penicilliopsis zonata CBS 506.65]|uniref:Vacuolar import and degradation protein-domain-containing protein n=1 Tax=Penicilliopsis zonata CBS 506.65 TaxID=1073090 RepID=A0A1L9SKM8_9EURO|nr:hypothetical protein ASPZODRAFT_131210 [Penicilliopsis zonata CBS 506.65]OJJ47656.1 hypothetical protein ASPZODRAFT_131210 [Penicilliopsis zonata CBS 506.65]